MVKMLQQICFILITLLLSASSPVHAFATKHSQEPHFHHQITENISALDIQMLSKESLLFDAILNEPSSLTANIDAIEELVEDDEDNECSSFKRQVCHNNQFCINQKLTQKVDALFFPISASYLQENRAYCATKSINKQVLFCIFRI